MIREKGKEFYVFEDSVASFAPFLSVSLLLENYSYNTRSFQELSVTNTTGKLIKRQVTGEGEIGQDSLTVILTKETALCVVEKN